MKKDKYFREYECKKCGYRGEEAHIYTFEDDEGEAIDETTTCPHCGEYEDFYCKLY